jgi:tetratricopeptide (TPR) repeat protein
VNELAEFLQSRGARLGLKIAGVVLALGLVGTAGWLWLRAEEASGQAALAAAAEAVQQGDGPLATAESRQKAIGMLQAVLAQHGRSAAAAQAAYQLGNLQYQAGDYAAARAAYEIALAKGAGGSLRTLSARASATPEAQKNYPSAVTAYAAAARGSAPRSSSSRRRCSISRARRRWPGSPPTRARPTSACARMRRRPGGAKRSGAASPRSLRPRDNPESGRPRSRRRLPRQSDKQHYVK